MSERSALDECIAYAGSTTRIIPSMTTAARDELADLRRKSAALERIGREFGRLDTYQMVDLLAAAGVTIGEDTPDFD